MRLWTNSLSVTIQMKVTEQHFTMVLFIMLYKVVLTSVKSYGVTIQMDATLQYFNFGIVFYAVQGGGNVCVCRRNFRV